MVDLVVLVLDLDVKAVVYIQLVLTINEGG